MAASKNKIDYIGEYNSQAYERIYIRVAKGKKTELENAAASAGQSVNAYVLAALQQAYGLDLSPSKKVSATPSKTAEK